jgi:hypothetical protein
MSDDQDAVEAVEGWFMDDGYATDKTFWQMGAEIITALEKEGFAVVRREGLRLSPRYGEQSV